MCSLASSIVFDDSQTIEDLRDSMELAKNESVCIRLRMALKT
jgi:hypothetical protein